MVTMAQGAALALAAALWMEQIAGQGAQLDTCNGSWSCQQRPSRGAVGFVGMLSSNLLQHPNLSRGETLTGSPLPTATAQHPGCRHVDEQQQLHVCALR